MLRFSTIHSIFSLDTLDSRLTANTPRSSSPPKIPAPSLAGTARNGESSRSQKLRKESSPSKWGTPEFWLYIIGVGIAVILMFKTTYDISKGVRLLRKKKLKVKGERNIFPSQSWELLLKDYTKQNRIPITLNSSAFFPPAGSLDERWIIPINSTPISATTYPSSREFSQAISSCAEASMRSSPSYFPPHRTIPRIAHPTTSTDESTSTSYSQLYFLQRYTHSVSSRFSLSSPRTGSSRSFTPALFLCQS